VLGARGAAIGILFPRPQSGTRVLQKQHVLCKKSQRMRVGSWARRSRRGGYVLKVRDVQSIASMSLASMSGSTTPASDVHDTGLALRPTCVSLPPGRGLQRLLPGLGGSETVDTALSLLNSAASAQASCPVPAQVPLTADALEHYDAFSYDMMFGNPSFSALDNTGQHPLIDGPLMMDLFPMHPAIQSLLGKRFAAMESVGASDESFKRPRYNSVETHQTGESQQQAPRTLSFGNDLGTTDVCAKVVPRMERNAGRSGR
jgi:hypothetical protein